MFIITKVTDKIRSLPGRYKDQLCTDGVWKFPEAERNYETLREKCPTATFKDIAELMNTDNWIRLTCDICKQQADIIAAFVAQKDLDVIVCEECLERALENLRERKRADAS